MFSILIYSALIQLNVFNFHLEGVVFGVIPCLYHRLYATPRSLLAAPSARSARTPRLLLEDSKGRRRHLVARDLTAWWHPHRGGRRILLTSFLIWFNQFHFIWVGSCVWGYTSLVHWVVRYSWTTSGCSFLLLIHTDKNTKTTAPTIR